MKTHRKILCTGAVAAFSLALATGLPAQTQGAGQRAGTPDRQPSGATSSPQSQTQRPESQQSQQMQQRDTTTYGQERERSTQSQQIQTRQQQSSAGMSQGKQTHKATKLIGMEIETSQGEQLGNVHDIVLNPQTGQIRYVVVSSGGVLGIGSDYKAVPPGVLSFSGQDRDEVFDDAKIVANITQQKWEQAPKFERDNLQAISSETEARQIYEYYGERLESGQQSGSAMSTRSGASTSSASASSSTSPSTSSSATREADRSSTTSTPGITQTQPRSSTSSSTSPSATRETDRSSTTTTPGITQTQPRSSSTTAQTQTQTRSSQQQSAQQSRSQQQTGMQASGTQTAQLIYSSELIGKEVIGSDQKEIGEIQDILVNLQNKTARFLVVEASDLDVQGQDNFAVPVSALQISGGQQSLAQQDQITLNLESTAFTRAQPLGQEDLIAMATVTPVIVVYTFDESVLEGQQQTGAFAGRQQSGQQQSGQQLTSQVRQQISQDQQLSSVASSIQISERSGTVTLEGTVQTEQQKQAAERTAKQVQGVTRVENKLEVSASGAASTGRLQPGMQQGGQQLTSQVREQLRQDQQLSSVASNIQVSESQGTVTLAGMVQTEQQKQAAERAAQQVRGVTRVENELEVRTSGGAYGGRQQPSTQQPSTQPSTQQRSQQPSQQQQPSTQQRSQQQSGQAGAQDQQLIERIREQIRQDQQLATVASGIRISASNATITLQGTVQSEDQKRQIERAARQVTGVSRVENQLEVRSSGGTTPSSPSTPDRSRSGGSGAGTSPERSGSNR